jgi:hypothetical protein
MTKISQLTNIGSALAADDEFVVRDVSDISTPNKKVTSSGIIDYIISQGGVSGFTQIAAGVGPLARVRTISSGTTGTILFETADGGSIAERARCDPAGRFLAGLTTANTSGAKLQTSDGITFPATQVASADPNTLDDYEEGTWTPVVAGSATAGTYTLASNTSKYTKIGRYVFCSMSITFSAASGGSGIIRISGLPFNYAAGSISSASIASDFLNTTSATSNGLSLFLDQGGSSDVMSLVLSLDNAAFENVAISAVSTSTRFFATISYAV